MTPSGALFALHNFNRIIMKTLNIVLLSFLVLIQLTSPVAAENESWDNATAVYMLLLKDSSQIIDALTPPIYEDPGAIPILPAGTFGAMGPHPVKSLSMDNPGYDNPIENKERKNVPYYTVNEENIRLKVTLFYPADSSTRRPVVFFIAGWHNYHAKQFYSLLYFIASHGYNVIFVPSEDFLVEEENHISGILEDVIMNPEFAQKLDLTKIGFIGHSIAGGILFHLEQQLRNWGTTGRFIFSMAGWRISHQNTIPYNLAPNTRLIVQTYNEELTERQNAFDTDPRFSIDYFNSSTIPYAEKTFLYLPGDQQHPSHHGLPKSKYDIHGQKYFYYDALQQVGIFRPLQSIMSYILDEKNISKPIGLPDTDPAMRTFNGIDFYSGDNPYVDLGIEENPGVYASNNYGYPFDDVTMATEKLSYTTNEDFIFHLEKMQALDTDNDDDDTVDDWVGIFPAGTDLTWGNQLAWAYTGAITDGTVNIPDNLPAGSYVAAAFFDDHVSKVEAKVNFSIGD